MEHERELHMKETDNIETYIDAHLTFPKMKDLKCHGTDNDNSTISNIIRELQSHSTMIQYVPILIEHRLATINDLQ